MAQEADERMCLPTAAIEYTAQPERIRAAGDAKDGRGQQQRDIERVGERGTGFHASRLMRVRRERGMDVLRSVRETGFTEVG